MRRETAHSFLLGLLVVCVIALGSVATYNRVTILHIVSGNCHQIELLKTTIRQSIGASPVGAKGTAGYAYYKGHPKELTQARAQITSELKRFRARTCS